MINVPIEVLQDCIIPFLPLKDVFNIMLTTRFNHNLVINSKRFETANLYNVNPFVFEYWTKRIDRPITMNAFLYFLQIPKKQKALRALREYKDGFIDISIIIIYTISCGTCLTDSNLTLNIDYKNINKPNMLIKNGNVFSIDYPYENLNEIPSIDTVNCSLGVISSSELLIKQFNILKDKQFFRKYPGEDTSAIVENIQ